VIVGRHPAPAEQTLTLFSRDPRDERLDGVAIAFVVRQEDESRTIRPGGRKLEGKNLAKERVGGLNQNAGAVARIGLAPARTAMLQIDQDLQRLTNDVVRATPLHVHDEADATGVMLHLRVVQTLSGGGTRVVGP
jgi:hypothetical protein